MHHWIFFKRVMRNSFFFLQWPYQARHFGRGRRLVGLKPPFEMDGARGLSLNLFGYSFSFKICKFQEYL